MARALRIEMAGAWYHVMNRGHRGVTLFRTDRDRRRFLGLVGELPEESELGSGGAGGREAPANGVRVGNRKSE